MARNRVIYQSEGLIVSSGASSIMATFHEQLERVQSANYSYTINRQDVNQYGELARIDSIVLDPPTVSVDFSYLLTDGWNERVLGFFVNNTGGIQNGVGAGEGNFASGHLVAHSGQNVYIITSPDGIDLNKGEALDSADTAIGIGNCYLSDYSVDLSVGALPTVNVTMEGANMNAQPASGNMESPGIDQALGTPLLPSVSLPAPVSNPGGDSYKDVSAITALRPGDITVNFGNVAGETIIDLTGDGTAHVQSASISLPLSRTPLSRLGTKFPFARTVDFPVTPTVSLSAIVDSTTRNNLTKTLDSGVQNVNIGLKDSAGVKVLEFGLKGVKVDSESYSSSIGANKSVDITFSATVGGPADTAAGIFLSGSNGLNAFVS